jgi:hypothetical protein
MKNGATNRYGDSFMSSRPSRMLRRVGDGRKLGGREGEAACRGPVASPRLTVMVGSVLP